MTEPEAVPAGAVSLEDDDAPAPVAEPVAAAPAAEPVAEPAAAEVDAVEVGGQKYVPLAAVLAERNEKKALKERANRADQLEQYVNQARPYIDFLQANPDLLKPRQATPQPAAPTVDPELVDLAETLSLYTPEGQPDVKKAAKLADYTTKRAKSEASQAVQPWANTVAEQRSAQNYHAVANAAAPNGMKPDANALSNLWRQLPANLTADPQVATLLQLMATGATVMTQRPQPAAPPNPPLVTEGSGGNPQGRPALTGLERRIAANRGTTETQFADLGKGFHPGRSSSLED